MSSSVLEEAHIQNHSGSFTWLALRFPVDVDL